MKWYFVKCRINREDLVANEMVVENHQPETEIAKWNRKIQTTYHV